MGSRHSRLPPNHPLIDRDALGWASSWQIRRMPALIPAAQPTNLLTETSVEARKSQTNGSFERRDRLVRVITLGRT